MYPEMWKSCVLHTNTTVSSELTMVRCSEVFMLCENPFSCDLKPSMLSLILGNQSSKVALSKLQTSKKNILRKKRRKKVSLLNSGCSGYQHWTTFFTMTWLTCWGHCWPLSLSPNVQPRQLTHSSWTPSVTRQLLCCTWTVPELFSSDCARDRLPQPL